MENEPLAKRRGWLKNGNPPGDLSTAARCGARTKRAHQPCRAPAMRNGRCRLHGGASTGPRTAAGLERARKARWKHGWHSKAAREQRARTRWLLRSARDLFRALDG